MSTPRVVRREVPQDDEALHTDPLARRVLLARGICNTQELRFALADLPTPDTLPEIDQAVSRLLQARAAGERVLIVGDYDCDGATSTAVAMLGLSQLGFEHVDYTVPNRFRDGYGLSPAIVRKAVESCKPSLIVTVDNGIASVEGVDVARSLGVDVIVTDHHLPPEELPEAVALVNPNVVGSRFPGGHLAGVGVIFYVLLALRAALAKQGEPAGQAKLAELLDLVAIGTVADVVVLDRINRTLVEQGLRRIRAGRTRPGVRALLERAGREPALLRSVDIGFAIGPRLNAAGRLDDMRVGIACLLATDPAEAARHAATLDALNVERRRVETAMRAEAEAELRGVVMPGDDPTADDPTGAQPGQSADQASDSAQPDAIVRTPTGALGLCLYNPIWHQGVIGILAGRLKDQHHRPVVVLTADGESAVKGSARSIPGVHVRDVLQAIAARQPGLLTKFGGHAMAAGMTLDRSCVDEFAQAFDAEVREVLSHRLPQREWHSDGSLPASQRTLDSARLLDHLMPWGQGLPPPLFDGEFVVVDSRQVGTGHLKLALSEPEPAARIQAEVIEAIAFGEKRVFAPGQRVSAVYALDINRWRNRESLQLLISQVQPLDP